MHLRNLNSPRPCSPAASCLPSTVSKPSALPASLPPSPDTCFPHPLRHRCRRMLEQTSPASEHKLGIDFGDVYRSSGVAK